MNRVRLRTAFCLLLLLSPTTAQLPFDCANAPGEPWRSICQNLVNMDRNARVFQQQQAALNANRVVAAPAVPEQPWLSPAVPQQFNPGPLNCMDLSCLCPFYQGLPGPGNQCTFRNGVQLQKAVRKELRTLSTPERQRLFQVLQQLKNNGQYDHMSSEHKAVGTASGAHSGPGFLPWHREFMKRIEIAIRLIDPNLALPYWDSVLDSYLPRPTDSILFSAFFAGETDAQGNVVNGPFAGWRTLEGKPYIQRAVGREGRLFTENDLNNVYRQTRIEQVLAYTVPESSCPHQPNFGAIEYTHASVHIFIGGDMKPPVTSANDPIFFFHHSFVDFIFENWRQMRQDRFTREQAYPPDLAQCANPQHFSNAIMRPYQITNRMGLSNTYTDNLYQYAARPACPNCGNSEFLFCDTRHNHCVAKVKMNGLCQGFEGQNVCYQGLCHNGVCVPGQFHPQQNVQAHPTTPRTPPSHSSTLAASPTPTLTPSPTPTLGSSPTPTATPVLITTPTQRVRAGITRTPQANSLHHSSGQSFARALHELIGTTGTAQAAVPRTRANIPRFSHQRRRQHSARMGLRKVPKAPKPPTSPAFAFDAFVPAAASPTPPLLEFRDNSVSTRRRAVRRRQSAKKRRQSAQLRQRSRRAIEEHVKEEKESMLLQNLRNPIQPAANMTLASANCFNEDPCCGAWARRGECGVNTVYMRSYCQRSCGLCQSTMAERHGCFDRHVSCGYWRFSGECTRRRQWMAENCRQSCGWCSVPDLMLCSRVAMMSRMA